MDIRSDHFESLSLARFAVASSFGAAEEKVQYCVESFPDLSCHVSHPHLQQLSRSGTTDALTLEPAVKPPQGASGMSTHVIIVFKVSVNFA